MTDLTAAYGDWFPSGPKFLMSWSNQTDSPGMDRLERSARSAARAEVGQLAVLCQSDAPAAIQAIDDAMDLATENGWDDVRLGLLHVKIIEAQTREPASSFDLIDELKAEAQRLNMRAMEAVAMIDRIRASRLVGIQEPYQNYAMARALLSDSSQALGDRVSGLINLAVEFDMVDLVELASNTLTLAAEEAVRLERSREALSVIAHNRSFALLRRAMSAFMVGDRERAQALFDEHLPLVEELDEADVPTSDSSELRAHRRVLEALFADADLDRLEAVRLIEALTARDSELEVVLRVLAPLDEWTAQLRDPAVTLRPEHEEVVRFLRLRAYRRAGVVNDDYLVELERYSAVLSARAERTRGELEAGVAAMVSAELLASERQELVAMTLSDPLTGLSNRRAFQSLMQPEDQRAATLLLVDLDDFKLINDTHGHQAGDDVLVELASILSDVARRFRPDVVARIGGDEFAVVLAGDRAADASDLAVEFTARVRTAEWGVLSRPPSASIGIASGLDRIEVFDLADANLYERKRQRRAPAP